MSKSDRDQRGRPHSGKRCPDSQSGGCPACHTGEFKRPARVSVRREKQRRIREQLV